MNSSVVAVLWWMRPGINAFIKGKSVLITGAGGSIGTQIAIAVASAQPKAVYLYDFYEAGLFDTKKKSNVFSLKMAAENCFGSFLCWIDFQ
jgi:FlaA1/EpsC-like NDP-sugar epimerase